MEKLPEFIAEYENDPRSGVQKLVSSAQKKIDALEKERQRIENLKKYEKEYAQYTYICGIDEVGKRSSGRTGSGRCCHSAEGL